MLHIIPEVVRHPHFEVPYPQLKRGQQSIGALVAVVRLFRYIYAYIHVLVVIHLSSLCWEPVILVFSVFLSL